MARLTIPINSDEQLDHILKAEEELRKAGVSFDTDSTIEDGRITTRDWELDWSLESATIEET